MKLRFCLAMILVLSLITACNNDEDNSSGPHGLEGYWQNQEQVSELIQLERVNSFKSLNKDDRDIKIESDETAYLMTFHSRRQSNDTFEVNGQNVRIYFRLRMTKSNPGNGRLSIDGNTFERVIDKMPNGEDKRTERSKVEKFLQQVGEELEKVRIEYVDGELHIQAAKNWRCARIKKAEALAIIRERELERARVRWDELTISIENDERLLDQIHSEIKEGRSYPEANEQLVAQTRQRLKASRAEKSKLGAQFPELKKPKA